MLFKKIEVAKISATREEAHFVLTKDKKLLIGQYPLKLNTQKSEFTLSKMDMNLGEYDFYLDDKWNSQIALNGKHINLGYFSDFEDVVKARKEAEEKYFREYSYDNSQKISYNICSTSLLGITNSFGSSKAGRGNSFLFIFPFPVRGSSCKLT